MSSNIAIWPVAMETRSEYNPRDQELSKTTTFDYDYRNQPKNEFILRSFLEFRILNNVKESDLGEG